MQQLAFSAVVVVAGMAFAAKFSGVFVRMLVFFIRALFGLVGLLVVVWLVIAALLAVGSMF